MTLYPARSLRHQRGLSFISLVFIGVLAVAVFAIGGQSLPILLEYQAIKKAAKKAAGEGHTVPEVRASFDRAAAIDNIASIRGADLEVTKVDNQVTVGYEYQREIPLVGPTYLVYRFKDQIR